MGLIASCPSECVGYGRLTWTGCGAKNSFRLLNSGYGSPPAAMLAPSPKATVDILADERWQLVQRIVSSPPFQKSTRLRELLEHVTERTIHGHAHELTEQQIGSTLFHKPLGYSSLEDSSVRVHARQLRLKLHEYFDEEGRNEPLILSIPKGSYTPIFKPATKAASSLAEAALGVSPALSWGSNAILAWALCGALTIVCTVLVYRSARHGTPGLAESATNPPWPFSQVFDSRHQTLIVVADSNYGMFRILTTQPGSLEQYLHRDFLQPSSRLKPGGADFRLNEYMTNSMLTSFADVADVAT